MSLASGTPVTMSAPASPCRSDDGVAVTLTPSSAGATTRKDIAATTPRRIRMKRLYAATSQARRNRAGDARSGSGPGQADNVIRPTPTRPVDRKKLQEG